MDLFQEFQRDEFTRHLITVKQHARPKRPIKSKFDMLRCVSKNAGVKNLASCDDDSGEENQSDMLQKLRNMCLAHKLNTQGKNVSQTPKNEF